MTNRKTGYRIIIIIIGFDTSIANEYPGVVLLPVALANQLIQKGPLKEYFILVFLS